MNLAFPFTLLATLNPVDVPGDPNRLGHASLCQRRDGPSLESGCLALTKRNFSVLIEMEWSGAVDPSYG